MLWVRRGSTTILCACTDCDVDLESFGGWLIHAAAEQHVVGLHRRAVMGLARGVQDEVLALFDEQ